MALQINFVLFFSFAFEFGALRLVQKQAAINLQQSIQVLRLRSVIMNEIEVARHFAHSRAAQEPIIFLMQSASVIHDGAQQLWLQLLAWPPRDVLAPPQVIIGRSLDLLQ